MFAYSLDDRSMDLDVESPTIKLEYMDDANNLMRLVVDEGTENHKLLYECPRNDYSCYISVLADNLDDGSVYFNVEHRQQEYCPCNQELIRVNTITDEQNILEQSTGSVGFDLVIYPESSKWLLTDNWTRGFYSDLFIYYPEVQEKQLVITKQGAFSNFGYAPDYSLIWYRITDYCRVQFVREDGSQIPGIDNADSILGWINDDQFLVVTANNNPPICSLTGVAVANIYGIGDWVLRGNVGQILLSPDHHRLIYTDDCGNSVCNSLKMLDLNSRETEILYEGDIYWIQE